MGEEARVHERRASAGEDVIVDYLGGYHRCYLDNPTHMEFISANLCKLLGYDKDEIGALIGDTYTCLLHPEDAQKFDEFILGFSGQERCDSIMQRLIRKDGIPINVVETMASRLCEDGRLRGYSVVCEIPDDVRARSQSLLSVLRVEDGPDSPIEALNSAASEMLSISIADVPHRFIDFIPINDRDKVREAFARAGELEYSGKGSCTVIGADGRSRQVVFWVEKLVEAREGSSRGFCFFAEDEPSYRRENGGDSAISKFLLTNLAEDVFEFDLAEDSVKRVSSDGKGLLECASGVRMYAEDALMALLSRVVPDDRQAVCDFFRRARIGELRPEPGSFARIRFGISNGDGTCQAVVAAVVPVSASCVFVCLDSNTKSASYGGYYSSSAIRKHVSVRMFGSFSVAVAGKTVRLKHEKAKELLALLVEKRGEYLSSREAIGALWECTPDERTRARYRKVASRLMSDLRELGVDYLVENERGARRIIPELIE